MLSNSGKTLHNTGFDRIEPTSERLFLTTKNDLQGLMDIKGRLLVNNRYQALIYLDNGYIITQKNGRYGLISNDGVDVIPAIYEQLIYNPVRNEYLAKKKSIAQKAGLQ